MMKIEPARPEDIYDVAVSMRGRDFEEFTAVNPADSRKDLAHLLVRKYGGRPDILCAWWLGQPVCVGAFLEVRPRVISLMMFATQDFPRVGLGLTRFIKKQMFPRLIAAGVHRIEAISLDGYAEVHGWLRVLGLEQETEPMRNYGKRGESFVQFVKVIDESPAGG